MLYYTNELALPNISNFPKHREEEVHDGMVVEGRVICHEELSRRERGGEQRRRVEKRGEDKQAG